MNKAEAEFWKNSAGERIADSTEILGFECGGARPGQHRKPLQGTPGTRLAKWIRGRSDLKNRPRGVIYVGFDHAGSIWGIEAVLIAFAEALCRGADSSSKSGPASAGSWSCL